MPFVNVQQRMRAKGSDQAASDVDLMVVSDTLSYGDVFGALDKVSRTLGRTVTPTVYNRAALSKRTKTDNALVSQVLEGPKVSVIGAGDSVAALLLCTAFGPWLYWACAWIAYCELCEGELPDTLCFLEEAPEPDASQVTVRGPVVPNRFGSR